MNYKSILPYKTIGIIGGGQLARMMCIAAKAMGYFTAVLDPTPNCPAGQVSDTEITASYDDMAAVKKLAELSDVITYEFENIDYNALSWLEEHAYLPQRSDVLKTTQHRFREKSAIKEMGLPVADFSLIDSVETLKKHYYFPSVLKTTTLGYDGKGQLVIRSNDDFDAALALAKKSECIIESFIDFEKEVSVIITRFPSGECSLFPVAENIHVNGILHQSIVPARISKETEEKAGLYAKIIAEKLDVIGTMGVEMFVKGEEIYINELAPRPHNSGHYTIDACITSQFEQHVRAVCSLPPGDTSLHSPVVMVNILGEHMSKVTSSAAEPYPEPYLTPYIEFLPEGKLHLYGKAEAKTGRKMGHLCMLGDIETSLEKIEKSGIW